MFLIGIASTLIDLPEKLLYNNVALNTHTLGFSPNNSQKQMQDCTSINKKLQIGTFLHIQILHSKILNINSSAEHCIPVLGL